MWGGGSAKNTNMWGGPRNFPFRPPQDFRWNSPRILLEINFFCWWNISWVVIFIDAPFCYGKENKWSLHFVVSSWVLDSGSGFNCCWQMWNLSQYLVHWACWGLNLMASVQIAPRKWNLACLFFGWFCIDCLSMQNHPRTKCARFHFCSVFAQKPSDLGPNMPSCGTHGT